jgi:hypothetical protein
LASRFKTARIMDCGLFPSRDFCVQILAEVKPNALRKRGHTVRGFLDRDIGRAGIALLALALKLLRRRALRAHYALGLTKSETAFHLAHSLRALHTIG